MNSLELKVGAALGLCLCALGVGCGTPGAPQPPSLNLPDAVRDLSATRAGNEVTLTWTMPKRNTDRTPIKGAVLVRICRDDAARCDAAHPDQMAQSGASDSYMETLPAALSTGAPRPINYFIELQNKKGRSAGMSNAAVLVAGEAPAQIDGLKAEVRKQGVVLSWTAGNASTAVRIERRLLSSGAKLEHGPLTPAPEPKDRNLIVERDRGRAIDKTVRFGQPYEYRAQRIARVTVNGQTLELYGAYSSPVQVDVQDVFPPDTPVGLVAVASSGENGGTPAIHLSWQPDAEADLAGYVVYRSEDGGPWQRISAGTPGVEPAFHDAQVQGGHTYRYAVTAVDKSEHESARSAAAQETVPQQ
jgi:hypothetical protein